MTVDLSVSNSVRLLWVPSHSNIPGNEVADVLAKQAATSAFVGPEPAIGINMTTVLTEIHHWANKEHQRVWESTAGYSQSRLFLSLKAQTRSWHDMHWALVGSIYVYLLAFLQAMLHLIDILLS